jgi:hypothetical protein
MSTVVLPGLAGRHDAASRAGRGLDILLSSEDTGGTAAVIDCHVPAATAGPPLHRHPASDETFVVISGTLLVHVDGQVTELTAGGLVHVSRGTPGDPRSVMGGLTPVTDPVPTMCPGCIVADGLGWGGTR